ncbi:sulfate permease [Burkholderiaceae bacterium FT117]|uniref:SulP family inorganic anion transporter n=1 Tax=Zeimonas sediminis TaxID=2944268 RepID=UPI002342FB08|nr:sulfate permease [Zeimonas sediminis]MCM5569686.1 sulfate permease [Zeimonas sediminis]
MKLPSLRFRPQLVDSLRGYTRDDLRADVSAGVTVGVVALPLAMAFGIASGVKPEQGIFTAIIAGLLISLLGGSRVQIGGPAGAFVVVLYAIVERYGVANLLISTFMAGILLFAMGALRMGNLIRYIPVSIVIGFTNGIAVIIALQQVKDFLGLAIPKMPANFFSQIAAIVQALGTINWTALALGAVSLVIVVLWPKSYKPNDQRWKLWMARVPGTIVVLVLGTLAVAVAGLQVETIGSRFGGIPQGLPSFELPAFEWRTAQNLVMPTLSIALLGAIESLLCARVADGITGDRHDPNQELMAQGVANFVAPFFGGIAATGTVARTVTNIRSGARSPIAGIVHALTLLLIVLALAPLAASIPLASLAAILLFVAWNMGDWHEFARLRQFSVNYRAVLLTTFLLTVVFDVTVAVQMGLLLASLMFIFRISSLTRIEEIALPADYARTPDGRSIVAYRVFGSLFFGSVTKLEQLLDPAHPHEVVVLEMDKVINLDTTGLDALENLHRMLVRRGGRLVIAEPNPQPLSLLRRSGFLDELGPDAVFDELDEALAALSGSPKD